MRGRGGGEAQLAAGAAKVCHSSDLGGFFPGRSRAAFAISPRCTAARDEIDRRQASPISSSMVSLLRRYTGRGPTRARTTIGEDVIVYVMEATLTRGEQALVRDGEARGRAAQPPGFQGTMR